MFSVVQQADPVYIGPGKRFSVQCVIRNTNPSRFPWGSIEEIRPFLLDLRIDQHSAGLILSYLEEEALDRFGQALPQFFLVWNDGSDAQDETLEGKSYTHHLMAARPSPEMIPYTPHGATCTVRFDMVSPVSPGDYMSMWQLKSHDANLNQRSGISSASLCIRVIVPVSPRPKVSFVADVTLPDGKRVETDQKTTLVKTWRFRNNGNVLLSDCVFSLSSKNEYNELAPRQMMVPIAPVAPGNLFDVSVRFSPRAAGRLKSHWVLHDDIGRVLSVAWVELNVVFEGTEVKQHQPASMPIFVKNLTGKTITLYVHPDDNILTILHMIWDREGISPKQMRLIHAGRALDNTKTLRHYNISKETILHLILQMDIGEFTALAPSCDTWLYPAGPAPLPPPSEVSRLVRRIKKARNISLDIDGQLVSDECAALLSEARCAELVQHLDHVSHARKEKVADCKLSLSLVDLAKLIGWDSVNRLTSRFAGFGGRVDEIKLRRVEAVAATAAPHCIRWHVDYALRTMQVPLNSDDSYEGGKLIFARQDGTLVMPRRPLGSCTLHEGNIVHGVTALESGVRYGCFLLQHHA